MLGTVADAISITLQILYAAQSGLGYSVGNAAKGLANNGMTDAERASLSVDDPEYQFRWVLPHPPNGIRIKAPLGRDELHRD